MTDAEISRIADALEERLAQRLTMQIADAVEARLEPRFAAIETRLTAVETRLDRIEINLREVETGLAELARLVDNLLDRIIAVEGAS